MDSLQPVAIDVRAQIARAAEVYTIKAESMEIVDDVSFGIAAQYLQEVQQNLDAWDEWCDPRIEDAMEAKRVQEKNRKALVDDKELRAKPLRTAKEIFGKKIGDYQDEVAALRQTELARIEAAMTVEATERAIKEAVALERLALTAPTLAERDAILAEVEAVLDEPAVAPARYIEAMVPPVPTIPGFSRPETWSAVVEISVFLKALVENKHDKVLTSEVLPRILEAIRPPLNSRARSLKSALNIIGVKAVSDKGTRMR